MRTIGFFGDSFINREFNAHSQEHNYQTYIKLVKDHFNLSIVNLGLGGSSVWDLYLNQLKPFIDKNEIPDISVFAWSNSGRLYHKECRSLHHSSVLAGFNQEKEKWFAKTYPNIPNLFQKDIWNAAKEYYLHLYDEEREDIAHEAFMLYMDERVFSKWPKDKKIIHCWSFGSYNREKMSDLDWYAKECTYPHRFKNGLEIRPPLLWLSLKDKPWASPAEDARPNHIGGAECNNILANNLINAIENYESGKLISMNNHV